MQDTISGDAREEARGALMADSPREGTAASKRDKKDPDRIGTERIGKLIWEFALPGIVMVLFNSLYNVIDTAFLGRAVGDVGVAVTTLANPVMTILFGFSMFAGVGGSTLGAISLGEGKMDKVERVLGNTAFLLVAISFAVAMIALFAIDPLLAIIGTSEELWEPTTVFVQIICVGFVFQSLGGGLNNFLRASGLPRFATVTSILGTAMCIVFNFLLVMVLGFGVAGSAVATILGEACGMVPVLYHFMFSKKAVFRLHLRNLVPNARLCGRILALGTAALVMQIAATVVSVVLNQMLKLYGATDPIGITGALAAVGVAQKAAVFSMMPMFGLVMSVQPLIGYNCGAHNWSRVLGVFKWTSVWAVGMGFVFFALAHLIPVQIVALFGVTGDLESFAVLALQVYTAMFPLVGFQITGAYYFQASGQPVKATVLELTRQILFLIPLYLLLPHLAGFFGTSQLMMLVVAVPVSDFLSAATTGAFVAYEIRKLFRVRAAEGPGNPCTPAKLQPAA